ncbi:MAG: hypothetical protein UT48_C0010G0045 [Parcubacteria group bacterium GW2011_GWE2_39_37]|uniref:Glutamyl-tRNA amidotransferase n=1 Tax=Candidatus Falkowbacteria bacterium GW2011_GWF2_39_8 TaxID=1618642 RepID=A0A0G0PYX4_9BACT|nr:MAG: hypothetical protein UT48_C0010G0045 [Parcubacteria group bacterium GW2011_GWE2_39_37]KKR33354.1 MAG: hypothetical protein UT64_C0010G0028 [Candidatus Falkowbacteria bacterium GW2011_GWF2_39_8]
MSNLEQKINEDLKQAMRDKNEMKLSVLRMLNSTIKNKMISLRSSEEVIFTDEQVMEIIASEVKKRQDAATTYIAGNREDLAKKENEESAILQTYLPQQLSDEELEQAIRQIVSANEGLDFGKLMGLAMAELKGKADGKRVGEMVKKVLVK